MIQVTPRISIDEDRLVWSAVRASGPGGQHVNKTSTAVELRFDVRGADLPEPVRERLEKLAGSRLTSEGVLVLFSQTHRSQEMNRLDALARLVELVRKAAEIPKRRIATRPTKASKTRRLDAKSRRGSVKSTRGRVRDDG